MDGRAVVIYNRGAGSARDVTGQEIAAALKRRGVAAELVETAGAGVTAVARQAAEAGAQRVIAAGGDGTISGVAQGLVGTPAVLGVLPIGTLNHFAKDLQVPLEWEAALDVAARGEVARVDVGEVNGRYFLNNSSIGIYPRIVLQREAMQRTGYGKWVALCRALIEVAGRAPRLQVRLTSAQAEIVERTPFVFIGNNDYELQGVRLGTRKSISGATLHVVMAHSAAPRALARAVWQVFRGGEQAATCCLDVLRTDALRIETRRRWLAVALDGEVVRMATPLRYRSHPHALAVAVAKDQERAA